MELDPDIGIREGLREDELERMFLRLMAKYQPPPMVNNGNGAFQKWMLAITVGLIVAGIPGLVWLEVYNSGRIAILETNVMWLMTHNVNK